MIKTENFNPGVDVKLLCTCGHPKCDQRSVRQLVLNQVQLVRDDFGNSMTVTSGGRCPYHPNETTKTKPGDHQECYVVDVACFSRTDETKLKVLAGRHGATRVAGSFEDGFIHMSWLPGARLDVPTWEY